MSYFYFEDSVKKTVENTPEGLRAAAKLLEEEAKKLDEPKLTPKQKRYMEKTEGSVDFALYKDGHITTFTFYPTKLFKTDSGSQGKLDIIKCSEKYLYNSYNLVGEDLKRSNMWYDSESIPLVLYGDVTYIDWYNL